MIVREQCQQTAYSSRPAIWSYVSYIYCPLFKWYSYQWNHQQAHIGTWHYGLSLTFFAAPLMLCLKQTICTLCQYNIVYQRPNHSIPASLTYYIPFTAKHEPNKLTCSQLCDFIAQLVRALHRHRRGHGFESR